MDKIKFTVRGSNIISSLNKNRVNESADLNEGLGGVGTEIGLPIDRPNCEGKIITRDEKEVDSITLEPGEWCWFYSGNQGIKYSIHNVNGKMVAFKDGVHKTKPTKEMKKLIKLSDNESTSVSGIATPTGRLHHRYEDIEEAKDAAQEEDNKDNTGDKTQEEDTEDKKDSKTELHTGIFIDKDGKKKIKCPECGSFDINIHDNGSVFHCVSCGYEWPTKDADDDGYEDEKEFKDDILVQPEEDEEENESKVVEATSKWGKLENSGYEFHSWEYDYDAQREAEQLKKQGFEVKLLREKSDTKGLKMYSVWKRKVDESMIIEAVDMKKRVTVYYDNVNKKEFDRDCGKFLDKIKSYLKSALGSKEDGLTDSLKAYIECSEVVGNGKWIDLYIYGWKDEYEKDEKSSSELNKIMIQGTKSIEHFVGDYLDVMPTTLWSAKIEMRGKSTEVGPYILYRWSEKEMDKIIGESRPVIESFLSEEIDEAMATWSFEYHDNGGGHKSFSVKAKDKTSAIDKGMAKAKKQAKGDITSWDCRLIKA